MPWSFGPKRLLRSSIAFVIVLLVLLTLRARSTAKSYENNNAGFSEAITQQHPSHPPKSGAVKEVLHRVPTLEIPNYCSQVKLDNIAFVIRTAATENKEKISAQLSTWLRCVPDPLIFSDLDQELGPYQIHDVLSRVSSEASTDNRDFDLYYKQKQLAAEGHEDMIESLASSPISQTDSAPENLNAAGSLDKYKFLHMIDRASEYLPNKDWYVFIDEKTYLSLPNLVSFLGSQSPQHKLYLGNAPPLDQQSAPLSYADGESGFILSSALVNDFTVSNIISAAKYDRQARFFTSGDPMVANALKELSQVKVTDVSPMLQKESQLGFPFCTDSWCKPVLSLRPSVKEGKALFDQEKNHGFPTMLYRDLFSISFPGGLPARADDWDNGSDDGKYWIKSPTPIGERSKLNLDRDPISSLNTLFMACEKKCSEVSQCLQFSVRTLERANPQCYLSTAIRWGKAVKPDPAKPGDTVVSGWMNERIASWIKEHEKC